MTDRRAAATLVAALVAVLTLASVAPAAAATDHRSLSCADGDTGADFLADGGLAVSDDVDAAVTVNPIVNDTALAFENVTVLANGSARVVLEAATADRVCVGAVDASGTPVTLAPDGFGSATVDGSLEGLAYGAPDYAPGTTDLAYNASAPVTITLADAPDPGTQVRAVDADTNRTLANATVASDGTVALSLPGGVHSVDLRTAEGEPEPEPEPGPTLSLSLSPPSIPANDSRTVAATVTNATGDPVSSATVALLALGLGTTTNATGVAAFTVAADAGNYSVVASADGFRNGTATLTVTAREPAVPPGAVYEPGSPAAAYDGTDGQRDGRIDISELGAAASDYATDELTIAELGDVAAAYAQS